MKSLHFIRRTFVYRDIPSSGLMCLLSIVRYHKGDEDPVRLLSGSQPTNGVTRLSDLVKVAETIGFRTKTGGSTVENLKKFPLPVILPIKNDWGELVYAVCYGFSGKSFLVGVPNWGLMEFREEEMEVLWVSRIVLYLEPSGSFLKKKISFNKICRRVVDMLFWGCMIVTLFIFIQIFFFSSFKIPSNSMEPGLIAGDYVLVNKLIPGARLFNVFAAMRGEQVWISRLPGIGWIERNDVIIFNYPYPNTMDKLEMHLMKYYIKRCVGLPGDSLSIVEGYYKIHGVSEPIGNREGQEIFSVQSNKMLKDANLYWSFPKDSLIGWNVKNFGPLYIPKKGDVIDMDRQNAIIYRKLIEWETGKMLSIENSENVLLDNTRITSYRFQKDYCFVAGDRIEDSQDSRFWGLLPAEFIVGKAVLIWKSMDSRTKEIQWNRVFKPIS